MQSFLKGAEGGIVVDQEEPGPSRDVITQEEEEMEMEETTPSGPGSSGGVGVALLDSSIAQLNSDDEDSD